MPLILAIEPDRRQANQLNAVVKGRLHADLVLADSAERALKELGDRVPDLILTSALLSPTDEVVLGDRLRTLNGVAAHVQTLTIPVLAAPRPRARTRAGGMLSALRRGKTHDEETPDGCDPSVFAAQCAEYLERAVAEQRLNASAALEERTPPIEESPAATAASTIDAKATREVEQIREFEAIDGPVAAAASPASSEPVVFTRSTNPFMADPVPAAPVAAQPVVRETFSTEPEPIAELALVAEEPSFAVEQSVLAAEGPVLSAEERVEPDAVRQPLDTPGESPVPRRREPAAPVVIDATAAAASVSEAIAQIEAYVARESLATETIAKLEANEFAETNWEAAQSDWEPAVQNATEDGSDEVAIPEGFIELDLSTLLEDPQADAPKRGHDDDQASLQSMQFESDDEPFVFDINEFNEFLIAAAKPAVKTENTFTAAAVDEPTTDAASTPVPIEKIAPPIETIEKLDKTERIDKTEKIEKAEVDAPVIESPADAGTSGPLVTPSPLGVSQLSPAMDGTGAEPSSLNKDGLAAVGTRTPTNRADSRQKPIQDEWGFFDPERCGFAALLAKLDEIIDTDDRSA